MTKNPIRISLVIILLMSIFIVITPHVNAGYVLSGETRITTDTGWDETPTAMQAKDGKIWVVWANRGTSPSADLNLYYRIFDGSTWSSVISLVSNGYDDESPSICQLANGTIYVAWATNRQTKGGYFDIFYKKTSDNGVNWSPDTQLTNGTDSDYSPDITQALDGTIWLVWVSYRTSNQEVFYKTYSGTSWSNDYQLTSSPPHANNNPSIMQLRNGTIFVFFSSARRLNFGDEIYYKTSSNNGASWSGDMIIPSIATSNRGPSPMQTKGEAGNIWFAYYASDATPPVYELYYRYYTGSFWSFPTQITFNSVQDQQVSVFQAQNSTIWFFWSSYRAPYDNYEIFYKTASAQHDIGITGITPTQNPMFQGYETKVQVNVKNWGLYTETFDVTLKYDDTNILGTKTVTNLAKGAAQAVTFSWNNTNIPYGIHSLSANASAVPAEDDLGDNSYSSGSVTVTIPGDVTGDNKVDIADYGLISAHWYPGPPIGPLDYAPQADINYDGDVNIIDVAIVSAHWGQTR